MSEVQRWDVRPISEEEAGPFGGQVAEEVMDVVGPDHRPVPHTPQLRHQTVLHRREALQSQQTLEESSEDHSELRLKDETCPG